MPDPWEFEYTERFASLDNWQNRPASHADWRVASGTFRVLWLMFYNTLIFKRPVAGDTELHVDFRFLPMEWDRIPNPQRATSSGTTIAQYRQSLPPYGAMNFNVLFKGAGPDGEDFLEVYDQWIGKGRMGLENFRAWFFTLNHKWARVRRCPGYELKSDRGDVRARLDHVFKCRILHEGPRLRYWLDDECIHDVTDLNGPASGHIGFTLSASQVEVSRFTLKSRG